MCVHNLDVVELDEAGVEVEAARGGGGAVLATAIVEHGVEGVLAPAAGMVSTTAIGNGR